MECGLHVTPSWERFVEAARRGITVYGCVPANGLPLATARRQAHGTGLMTTRTSNNADDIGARRVLLAGDSRLGPRARLLERSKGQIAGGVQTRPPRYPGFLFACDRRYSRS